MRLRERLRDDTGSAVVESTMVMVLLLALFLALVQLGVALHVRNTLVACAAEGARYGANADRGPGDAAGRTTQLIRAALADSFADSVDAAPAIVDGVPTMEVTVTTTLPVVGLLGPARALTVRGHAFEEAQTRQ